MRELKFIKRPVATSTRYVVVLQEWLAGILVASTVICKHPFKQVSGANSFARKMKKDYKAQFIKLYSTSLSDDQGIKTGLQISVVKENELLEVTKPNILHHEKVSPASMACQKMG